MGVKEPVLLEERGLKPGKPGANKPPPEPNPVFLAPGPGEPRGVSSFLETCGVSTSAAGSEGS